MVARGAGPDHEGRADRRQNEPLETWNTETLIRLPADSIHNDVAYNKFKAGPYDIVDAMGAHRQRSKAEKNGPPSGIECRSILLELRNAAKDGLCSNNLALHHR
jgi:hypothetical protein